jgi:hypothetical protein
MVRERYWLYIEYMGALKESSIESPSSIAESGAEIQRWRADYAEGAIEIDIFVGSDGDRSRVTPPIFSSDYTSSNENRFLKGE